MEKTNTKYRKLIEQLHDLTYKKWAEKNLSEFEEKLMDRLTQQIKEIEEKNMD